MNNILEELLHKALVCIAWYINEDPSMVSDADYEFFEKANGELPEHLKVDI